MLGFSITDMNQPVAHFTDFRTEAGIKSIGTHNGIYFIEEAEHNPACIITNRCDALQVIETSWEISWKSF